ncbi:MAG: type II toxin-antitoxin system RelE/ParE family toxin [Ignavibacteria bacterium]|nr:type II toxin-antitoxin system RelE/ParE family toxin [Ignavibacteria bacterium]
MTYNVVLSKRAIKALEKIPEPYYSKIKASIYSLSVNPRPVGYKKLNGRKGFRIRVSDYRIIYDVHDDILSVEVVNLGNRKDIYE